MVKITEPMTMITDYILTIQAIIYAVLIFQQTDGQISRFLWGVFFVMIAFGALVGGTTHGFKANMSVERITLMRRTTGWSVGLSGILILVGILFTQLQNNLLLIILIALIILSYLIYVYWIFNHPSFINVIMYYAPLMAIIVIIELFSLSAPSAPWIIFGLISMFVGFGVQAKKKGIHKHLNHNDIFHFIQMLGNYLLFKGVLLLEDY